MRNDRVDESQVLTLAEAARLIRVSKKALGEMARRQRIPCQKAGAPARMGPVDCGILGGLRRGRI